MNKVLTGLAAAARYEGRLWHSLYRWVLGRPAEVVGPGGATFGYAQAVTPLLWVFIGVSMVEIPILHLILPWPTARYIALALGAYGLIWMIGLLASLKVHPHVLDGAGLRLRGGISQDFTIPWDAVERVRYRRRSIHSGGQTQVEREPHGPVLLLGVGSQTAVDVVLREPRTVPVGKTKGEPVIELRFHADDPEGLVRLAEQYVPARNA